MYLKVAMGKRYELHQGRCALPGPRGGARRVSLDKKDNILSFSILLLSVIIAYLYRPTAPQELSN